ncbi:hypothetical protein [Haloferula sp. A504]|uniref:hypothetical protein n=1 Tax=Haloferula sp. A504 TaxID=3373601 RepID=UPI0031C4F3A4|nr:hypothetical protein [Verrucomicrobiaceae bacterium E54]
MSPPFWFFATCLAIATMNVVASSDGKFHGQSAVQSQRLLIGYIMAWWISWDSRKSLPGFPSDWGFLAAGVIFPVYWLTTRGWRGFGWLLLIGLGIAAIFLAGEMVSPAINFDTGR